MAVNMKQPEELGEVTASRLRLSARQSEIMDLVTRGLTNKEIAQHLGLSDGTIKQHLFAIFQRLGVSNRTWAVAIWQTLTSTSDDAEIVRTQRTARLPLASVSNTTISTLPRRLIATVAIALPQHLAEAANSAEEEAASGILTTCQRWAEVFEGSLSLSGASSILVTFGYPRAHFDDTERALAFAEAVRIDLRSELGIQASIAVDAAIDRLHIYNGDVALSSTAWHGMQMLPSSKAGIVLTERAQHATNQVLDDPALTDLTQQQLYRAPFFREVESALTKNRASWFAVEAWPPLLVKVLLDAWCCSKVGRATRQIVLRLPSSNIKAIEPLLLAQLDAQVGNSDTAYYPEADLGWRLHALAQQGPLSVLVYGMDESTTLANLLDAAAIDALATCSVVFLLSSLPVRGPARISTRTLDQNGRKPLVGRVHELILPDTSEPGSHYCPDIVALIDKVDDSGKTILKVILKFQRCTSEFLAQRLDLTDTSLALGLKQLGRLGLVSMWPDGSIRLRDARTARAILEQLGDRA
jgi:DNA-binding CsgD family transcriptional regulator